MFDDSKKAVETLIQQASKAEDSGDAMRFAQAALNAANALCSLKVVVEATKTT